MVSPFSIKAIEKEVYGCTVFPSWIILRTLVIANFKCHRLEGIEKAFEEVKARGYKPDLVIYNSMLSMYAKNGMYSKATEMFDSIKQSGLSPDLITYNSLMDMYAKCNESWEAEKVLNKLKNSPQVKPDVVSYNTVINGFCKQGLIKEAQRILSEMIADGKAPCVITYHTLVGDTPAWRCLVRLER
jgi:pentatricopeptide repeat domain-containing protein 1